MRLGKKKDKKENDEARPTLSRSEYVENGWRIHPPKGFRLEKIESSAVRVTFKLKPD